MIFMALLLALYFAPTIVAAFRGHRQGGPILALNLLLGWTLVGWVVALVWSLSADKGAAPPPAVVAPAGDARPCPYCAETIKRAAKVCRYCNRDVEPGAVEADPKADAQPWWAV